MIHKDQTGKTVFMNKVGGFPLLDGKIYFLKNDSNYEGQYLPQGYSNRPIEQYGKANQILGQNPLMMVESLSASATDELASVYQGSVLCYVLQ